jgi:predicted alpha/beta-hydrolase family hydrolase
VNPVKRAVKAAKPSTFAFDVEGARTSARVYRGHDARGAVVLAHGAGAPQTHPWMVAMARAMAARGLDVVTFNFLYSEARRRAPDRNEVLEQTWQAALDAVRARAGVARGPIVIGGKSMGGRIATQAAARGLLGEVAGIVLLGYPLHPPGKPEQLRVAHLPKVRAPMLFVQGSRDAFGTPDELTPHLARLARGTRLLVIEGGDHSLVPPRRSGDTLDRVMARVADAVKALALK